MTQMNILKKWLLFEAIDSTDIEFLTANDISCFVNQNIDTFYTMNQQHKVVRSTSIEITTTCEKEELLLKLKYGDKCQLLEVSYEI